MSEDSPQTQDDKTDLLTGDKTDRGLFKPGQSGNPNGRPKGASKLAKAIRARGDELLQKLWDLAESEDQHVALGALKELYNRGYGKSPDRLIVDGEIKIRKIQVLVPGMTN